ncbi:Lipase 3 [Orchesella cincta]|uniref:Lipase n=1 Tax=Orchesella cincta TaxID=48709 RepID=A0A1D2N7H7_ORCCI|nr:Lipase 3 [Orchesella cincta]
MFPHQPQILKTYDYPFKTYNVTTKDGYILTVYRITGSPKLTKRSKSAKQAVYLNHGLGGASDTWNFQPDSRNLPFKLADAGYEVWLGNCRGSTYSLKHKKYNANIDFIRYWDFSFHEMGIYDVPAVTDKILSETKTSKIFYIGHSMATTQYFVALSELPEMNDKIEAAFLLAPIAYIGHMNNGLRLVAPLLATDAQYHVANLALMGRFQSAQQFRQQFQVSPGDLCDLTATKCGLCDNLIFLLFGYDASQMNNTELPNMFAKIPNNIGLKCVAHYSQNILTCRFQKYDYGMLRNLIEYGSIWAPEYDLQNINAPTYLFYAEQDNLGPPNDVEITARKLKSGVLKGKFKVKNKLFNHADFIIAKDADKLVYNKILSEMKKYKAN